MKIRIVFLLLLLGALWSVPASAQTPIVNPAGFEFSQNGFNAVDGLGNPTLTGFEALFFQAGATAPMQITPFAKTVATLVTGTTYRVLFNTIPSYPIGVNLTLRIRAVGPGGTSNISNPAASSFIGPVPAPADPTNVTIVQ